MGEEFGELGWSGPVKTVYSSTCSHCQHGTDFPSKRNMMDYVEICRGCMRLICLECYDKLCKGEPCETYEQKTDRKEAEEDLHRKLVREGWRCY